MRQGSAFSSAATAGPFPAATTATIGWSALPGSARPAGRARKVPSGYVFISTREDTVVAPVRRQLLWVAVAAGLAVALCALAGYKFASRKILRPLKVLREAARAVSETARLRESDEVGGGAATRRATGAARARPDAQDPDRRRGRGAGRATWR